MLYFDGKFTTYLYIFFLIKADFLEVYESNPRNERKRLCHRSPQEELNVLMWEWFQKAGSIGILVSGPKLQEKALSFAKNLGIKENDF